jgi:hypothetical protein
MTEKKVEEFRVAPLQIFDCGESLPIPPGTKSRAKLPRGLEELEEPNFRRWWLATVSAVVVALAMGVLVGRFLLP